ncbi:MAG: translation initiation factor IF-2 N-terminal domain-containing protein, partial [bacterium]
MSTRVHELAKDLNIKSQVILDFLKTEGLLIKASVLASLEPDQIEKIRHHFGNQAAEAPEKPAPKQPSPPEPKAAEPAKPVEPPPTAIVEPAAKSEPPAAPAKPAATS